jgi:hypothetical protein
MAVNVNEESMKLITLQFVTFKNISSTFLVHQVLSWAVGVRAASRYGSCTSKMMWLRLSKVGTWTHISIEFASVLIKKRTKVIAEGITVDECLISES